MRAVEGVVRTVACFQDILLIRETLEQDGQGAILVIDGGGSLERALFGDAMAARMVHNRWAGVIVNGAVRDVAEIDSLPIAVKALGTCPRRGGTLGEGRVDVPVSFGGVTFMPGAWLIADDDGVVVLPQRPSREQA
jgi:regulator of ribonuclease activity A